MLNEYMLKDVIKLPFLAVWCILPYSISAFFQKKKKITLLIHQTGNVSEIIPFFLATLSVSYSDMQVSLRGCHLQT